jgi:hypothetical protein
MSWMMLTGGFDVPKCPIRPPVQQTGMATTYGLGGLHGDTLANGEPFRPEKRQTCAHKSLELGSVILVESASTGKSAWCVVRDRGPYAVKTDDGEIKAVSHSYKSTDDEKWVRRLDTSVAMSKALGEWGLFKVRMRYWPGSIERVGRFASVQKESIK